MVGVIMNLFYNNFTQYPLKAEIVCREEEILKVSLAPASPIKRNKFREDLSNRQIDTDNKIYSESFIENILPIYMVVISAKYSFVSLFLHFTERGNSERCLKCDGGGH